MRNFINIVESITAMPTISLQDLFHVGSLNPDDKRAGSYEGAGLSVSTHPDEWREIARGMVGGDTWSVNKQGNQFLDFHSLSTGQRDEIINWGSAHDLCTTATVYTVTYFDVDTEDYSTQTFPSKEDAEEERDFMEWDADIVEHHGDVQSTPLLDKATLQSRPAIGRDHVIELLVPIYAAAAGLDGVWWDDDLAPEHFSAPRGVIVPHMVSTWTFTKVNGINEQRSTLRASFGPVTILPMTKPVSMHNVPRPLSEYQLVTVEWNRMPDFDRETCTLIGHINTAFGAGLLMSKWNNGDEFLTWCVLEDGRVAAFFGMKVIGDYNMAKNAFVAPDFGGKGLMSEIVLFFAKTGGHTLISDTQMTQAGVALWDSVARKLKRRIVYIPTGEIFDETEIGDARTEDGKMVIAPADDSHSSEIYSSNETSGQCFFYIFKADSALNEGVWCGSRRHMSPVGLDWLPSYFKDGE